MKIQGHPIFIDICITNLLLNQLKKYLFVLGRILNKLVVKALFIRWHNIATNLKELTELLKEGSNRFM